MPSMWQWGSWVALGLSVSAATSLNAAAPSSLSPSRPPARPTPQAAPATKPAQTPSTTQRSPVEQLEHYYADLYGRPLKEKNRLSQLIGVVSLSRIDGPALNAKLLEALAQADVLVGQLAWEALHARHASLSPDERTKWLVGGMEVARKGGFAGATIAPLLAAAAELPPASYRFPAEVLTRVAEENDPAVDEGKTTLASAGALLSSWSDTKVVQILIAKMSTREALAPRLAAMLQTLPEAPEPSTDPAVLKASWSKFARNYKPAAPTTRPAYSGKSDLFDPPKRIEDPQDPQWRKELELPDLRIDSVEIAFLIDATGSMAASNDYVTAYVETVTRLLKLMSEQVRAGTIYYRHEVDEAIMIKCCRTIGDRKDDFRVRILQLTDDPASLVTRMRAQKLQGRYSGHDGDGAYAGGISTAMKGLQWNPKGKRIIACTGDAHITPGSDKAMLDLAQKAKDTGYLLMFIVRDTTAAKDVAPASKLATGFDPIIYKPDIEKIQSVEASKASAAATAGFEGTAFEKMTMRVLELSVPPDYRPRVEPLIRAVLPILQAQDAAGKASATVRK